MYNSKDHREALTRAAIGRQLKKDAPAALWGLLLLIPLTMLVIGAIYFELTVFFGKRVIFYVLAAVIAAGIYLLDLKKRNRVFWDKNSISVTQKFMLVYMAVLLLSFVFSPVKEETLWGTAGWYLGTIPLFILGGFVLMISHFWKEQKWLISGSIIVSGIVFFLAICNRFSFYPIY